MTIEELIVALKSKVVSGEFTGKERVLCEHPDSGTPGNAIGIYTSSARMRRGELSEKVIMIGVE